VPAKCAKLRGRGGIKREASGETEARHGKLVAVGAASFSTRTRLLPESGSPCGLYSGVHLRLVSMELSDTKNMVAGRADEMD
jgi:hypothetical protein